MQIARTDGGPLVVNQHQLDPTDESRFGLSASIDQPALLMLTETRIGTVPVDFHTGSALVEQADMVRRTSERVALELLCLFVWPPEDEPHVNAAGDRTIKDIQRGPSAIRHQR